jgi:glutamine synthetase
MDAKQILESSKEKGIQFVDLQFTDLAGALKAMTIPASKLADVLEQGIWFDGSSIEGFTRIAESDMYLKPDLSTFAVLPWTVAAEYSTTARLICDVHVPNGDPFSGDPRYILKRQMARAEAMGYTFNTGPEYEFFLLKRDQHGALTQLTHDKAGYFDLTMDRASEVRKKMTLALQALNVDVEALHHEVAHGQHEIDFKYNDALTTADSSVSLKFTIKTLAIMNNLTATFMPKPFDGHSGNGMHVHQSFFQGDSNAFLDLDGQFKLSQLAHHFIAGQLHHIKDIVAITNPLVNSYKRLLPGYEAPTYIAWGQTNRSALIRIPRYTPGRDKSVRAELRCPDPSSNIYLTLAVILAAGLDGIEKKMMPPTPIEDDVFEMSKEELTDRGVEELPASLKEALNNMEQSELVRDVLGEHAFETYLREKTSEWNEFSSHVSNWEREKYVESY